MTEAAVVLLGKHSLMTGAVPVLADEHSPMAEESGGGRGTARRLAEAGKVLGIRLVDHLILGEPGRRVSLSRRGGW